MATQTINASEIVASIPDTLPSKIRGTKSWFSEQQGAIRVAWSWHQEIFAQIEEQRQEQEGSSDEHSFGWSEEGPGLDWYLQFLKEVSSTASQTGYKAFNDIDVAVRRFCSGFDVGAWNEFIAYTDFDALPKFVALLVLAESMNQKVVVPGQRILLERCRDSLRRVGFKSDILARHELSIRGLPKSDILWKTAHVIACLEEEIATNGYTSVAIELEKQKEIRLALACIYRNVRYRLRDGQLQELNQEVSQFAVEDAAIDTILAMLTATAPAKKLLSNRKSLFKKSKHVLHSRGELEPGLLDGLG